MVKVADILNNVDLSKVADYMQLKAPAADKSQYLILLSKLKSLSPADSDLKIADMIVVDESSPADNPEYYDEIIAYRNVDSAMEYYDFSDESWEKVLGMDIIDASLQLLLPIEVLGDIVLYITSKNQSSPQFPQVVQITKDNFTPTREMLYKACNMDDDRTEIEKEYDKEYDNRYASYTFNRMQHLLGQLVKASTTA